MKKLSILYLLFLACLSFIFIACNSSSEEEQEHASTFQFRAPLLSWSVSQQEVIDYMCDYVLVSASPYSLVYEGKNSESSYLYAFSDQYNTLTYVVVTFPIAMKSEAIAFLKQHYDLRNELDGSLVLSDNITNTTITVTSDNQSLIVTYMSHAYMGL